jgi:pyruvate, orthophosphate dikinase
MQKYIFNFLDDLNSNELTKRNLGTKGYNLFNISKFGVNVPAGFTISSEVSRFYFENNQTLPENLMSEIRANITSLEENTGKKFADTNNPLLVSVRSGSEVSMPGMMDTILNLGLNSEISEYFSKKTNFLFAYDCYIRFIQMFSEVVLGLDYSILEREKSAYLYLKNKSFSELEKEEFVDLVEVLKKTIKNNSIEFPEDPYAQLEMAVVSVINSWNSQRAKIYRKLNNINSNIGTAVTIQSMVFGNYSDKSCTGVLFTRNPINGEKEIFGEYILKAQGEDIVSGKRTPSPILEGKDSLKEIMPKIYKELLDTSKNLEEYYKDMQDVEFTVEDEKLYILQTRTGKRSAAAAVKIAYDFVVGGIIDEKEAIMRIDPKQIDQLLHPIIEKTSDLTLLSSGLAASPGAANGKVVFTSEDAEKYSKDFDVILVRNDTCPDDINGMSIAKGIITARGGLTSHAAVVARGMGKPCVCGVSALEISADKKYAIIGGGRVNELDDISFDGSTGEIFKGVASVKTPESSEEFEEILTWSDKYRKLRVRANAETPKDALMAMKFGAEGIGLCRTEHMFFEKDKISLFRQMILTDDAEKRNAILSKIKDLHSKDFEELLTILSGKPLNIRLLDPPLHEFLPSTKEEILAISAEMNIDAEIIISKLEKISETNPMLGHRGARLGITNPEIYQMQVEAIILAAIRAKKLSCPVNIEIMLPLISNEKELDFLKKKVNKKAQEIMISLGEIIDYKLGTMIELPRAAIISDKIARKVDYFSYGTNDLTQTVYGISRDDISSFMPEYTRLGVFEDDPFSTIDQEGVGTIIIDSLEKGKKANSTLSAGICGEHGGDPKSIDFFHKIGLSYVSCSPYRIPVAKIAAAQAAIKHR